MLGVWNVNGIPGPISFKGKNRKKYINSMIGYNIHTEINNTLDIKYKKTLGNLERTDFIFILIDIRSNTPVFHNGIKYVSSLPKKTKKLRGAGGVSIALGGAFSKPKLKILKLDYRIAMAVRIESQIPILVIALYLPRGKVVARKKDKKEEKKRLQSLKQ